MSKSVTTQLPYTVPLTLRGFADWASYRGLSFYSVTPESADTQFERFFDTVHRSVGRRFLPIYRMADGEFAFLLGTRTASFDTHRVPFAATARLVRDHLSRLGLLGYGTMWGEKYTASQLVRGRKVVNQLLPRLGEQGIVAPYLLRRGDAWGQEYITPAIRHLSARGVPFRTDNYVPFYFVYALLASDNLSALISGRRILVITHMAGDRGTMIRDELRGRGARSVQLIGIPSSQSVFQHIDVARIESTDLCLVAAGIGSIAVIMQLERLGVPAIDCGIVIEGLLNPKRLGERPFLRKA